jgi:hypothetical protein
VTTARRWSTEGAQRAKALARQQRSEEILVRKRGSIEVAQRDLARANRNPDRHACHRERIGRTRPREKNRPAGMETVT